MAGEIVTKSKRFYCVSIFPDICLTPLGPTMVPVPYIIIGEFSEATGVSPNVTSNGEPVVIHASTVIPSVRGDEPGTGKGIKSGTVGGRVQSMEKSSTLWFNGERALRVGDLVYMNDKNTIGKIFERRSESELAAMDRPGKQGEHHSSHPGAGLSEALAALQNVLKRGAMLGEGGTVAKKTVEFIPRSFLNSVPGEFLPALELGAAAGAENAPATTLSAMPLATATDGGVSRGREAVQHAKSAVDFKQSLDDKFKEGTLNVFDEYAETWRANTSISSKLSNSWELFTYNHPEGMTYGNVAPTGPNHFALALENMAANPLAAVIGGWMANRGDNPEDIYYATKATTALGGVVAAGSGIPGRTNVIRTFKPGMDVAHFEKHGSQIAQTLGIEKYTLEQYVHDANLVIRNGTFVPELNAYVSVPGGTGSAKGLMVGVDRASGEITTMHLKPLSWFEKKAPSLGWVAPPKNAGTNTVGPDPQRGWNWPY